MVFGRASSVLNRRDRSSFTRDVVVSTSTHKAINPVLKVLLSSVSGIRNMSPVASNVQAIFFSFLVSIEPDSVIDSPGRLRARAIVDRKCQW